MPRPTWLCRAAVDDQVYTLEMSAIRIPVGIDKIRDLDPFHFFAIAVGRLHIEKNEVIPLAIGGQHAPR